jgi:hypothetical protein
MEWSIKAAKPSELSFQWSGKVSGTPPVGLRLPKTNWFGTHRSFRKGCSISGWQVKCKVVITMCYDFITTVQMRSYSAFHRKALTATGREPNFTVQKWLRGWPASGGGATAFPVHAPFETGRRNRPSSGTRLETVLPRSPASWGVSKDTVASRECGWLPVAGIGIPKAGPGGIV